MGRLVWRLVWCRQNEQVVARYPHDQRGEADSPNTLDTTQTEVRARPCPTLRFNGHSKYLAKSPTGASSQAEQSFARVAEHEAPQAAKETPTVTVRPQAGGA